MQGSEWDEDDFFRALEASKGRFLLIGRRALVVLGMPVLTADYDFWIHIDDIETLNELAHPFDLRPSRTPDEARAAGRYVLENDEHVDVLVARSMPTVDGMRVAFEDVWSRRQSIPFGNGISVAIPSIDDLILTKRFGARRRDATDIAFLEALKKRRP